MQVVFDLDGTLYKTEHALARAVAQTAGQFGLAVRQAQLKQAIGLPSAQFLQYVFGRDVALARVQPVFRAFEREAVREAGALFEGVPVLLEALRRAGDSLYICSTGSQAYIRTVLDAFGLTPLFDGLYGAGEFGSKAEVLRALRASGGSTVFVGDTAADFAAAREAETPFLLASYGYGDPALQQEAAFSASCPGQLLPLLNRCRVYGVIERRIRAGGSRLVGINGVDTSGKSCFTQALSQYLGACGLRTCVVHVDDFHNPRHLRLQGDDEVQAYYAHAFDYECLIDELLLPLRRDGQVHRELCCLDLDTDTYSNAVSYAIGADTVVLLEGVLLYRAPLLPYFDLKIFLDIPFAEVLRRAERRDVPKYGAGFLKKYKEKYIPVQQMYLDAHRPQESSEIWIDNTDYDCPKILRGSSGREG